MHAAGKVFVKTYLKAIRDILFPNMWNFRICNIFIKQRGESLNFKACRETPPSPQFPHLMGHHDLLMRKTLREVGLLTIIILFQSKKFTACKTKDGKKETVFCFLMVFNLLKIIHPFESKKHLRTYWNLVATHGNIWYVTNRFK